MLAYRLIWNVIDQVTALGDTPPADATHQAQRTEHQALTTRLAGLRA
ncbi:hypothetical protein K8Z49_37550 [Actinomadura madurae]